MSKPLNHFEELYMTNFNALCNVSNRIIGDKESAKDIVQEVFVSLWGRKEELPELLNAKGYLFRAVTNASINHLILTKKTTSIEQTRIIQFIKPNERTIVKELEGKIQFALENLPPKCRAIFVLSRFEEMKYKEIAKHLDISIKTVENQMGIALSRMREELKPYLTKEFLSQALAVGLTFLAHFLSVCLIITWVNHLF